ncbi:MAG: efflux RND transporter periplasmic adaptor subunit [Pseudomonadota bacterium]
MSRSFLVAALAVIAVALVSGGLAIAHRRDSQRAPAAPAASAVPVVAGKVLRHDVPIYLRGVGTVIAYNTVVVRSQIQGELTRIAFTEGQPVRAGDLLAEIDPRPFQAQLDQVTATRDRDRAQLVNAEANLARYTELGSKGWASQQLVDTQRAQVAQLESAIKADEALIAAASVQLGYTRLTSPIGGITGVRQIDIGNIIHPADPGGLVVVTQIQPISVIFTLPETDLPRIQEQMARGPLPVLAYSQDDKIELDRGRLALLDNEILQTTGSVRLKAEFPNLAHRLWPGELIDVWLQLELRHDGLTVATSAVQQGPGGAYVYVIGSDDTVSLRPVTVDQVSGGQALIAKGLAAGESVVVDGQYRLKAGSRVVLLHGKAAAEAESQDAGRTPIP